MELPEQATSTYGSLTLASIFSSFPISTPMAPLISLILRFGTRMSGLSPGPRFHKVTPMVMAMWTGMIS